MAHHETIEAGVLGGVALLFVVAIVFVAWADDGTHAEAPHGTANQASPAALPDGGVAR